MCEVCTMSAAAKVVLCTVEIPVSSGRVVTTYVVFLEEIHRLAIFYDFWRKWSSWYKEEVFLTQEEAEDSIIPILLRILEAEKENLHLHDENIQ